MTKSDHDGKLQRSNPARDSPDDIELRDLTTREKRIIHRHETANAKLVHEIIRLQGITELERPWLALLWSAIGAGFVIGLSPYLQGVLGKVLPDSSFKEIFVALGYALGFIAVIAGRMQLFTESTLTAVLPLATTPTLNNFLRTVRLWVIVFAGNLIGTLVFAGFVVLNISHQPEIGNLIREHSIDAVTLYQSAPFFKGIPAGFLLAVLVWSLPNLEKQEIWIIIAVTWTMAMAGVAHSIVGAAEMWVAILTGDMTFASGVFGFLLPAAAGNLVGGSVLFALLAHAQVRAEINVDDEVDR